MYRDLKEVIIDSAHNPAGMKALREYIEFERLSGITMGIGLLDGPNWKELIDVIHPIVGKLCFMTPPTQRALSQESIEEYVSCLDVKAEFFGNDFDSFLDKHVRDGGSDRILLAGSMYLVGELRHRLFGPIEGTFNL
jgi:dihydrofolate synthase/folylpolyglutamate synthase